MFSQYIISPVFIHPVRIPLQCPGPVRIPFLLSFSSWITCSAHVSTQFLLSMSSQYTISPVHVQSVHKLAYPCHQYTIFYPCPVRIPPLLPITTSQNSTVPAHVISPAFFKSEYHLSIHVQSDTISPTLVQSDNHIFCPCPVSMPSFQFKFS